MVGYFKHLNEIFVAAPCMLTVLSPLFVQLKHTNYYKIVKQLKSFKIIIVAPTCIGLHKPIHVGATLIILNDFNCLTIL